MQTGIIKPRLFTKNIVLDDVWLYSYLKGSPVRANQSVKG
jgi:hypothetical protein